MSIDAKKLKKILTRNEMLPLEFFCFKGESKCALVKCFLHTNSQYLFIYIPSKFRFSVSDQGIPVYDLEDLDDDNQADDDDYAKKENDSEYADQKLEEVKRTKFELLHQKYQCPITLQGSEEPIARKLTRQLQRLNTPLTKSNYSLALQQDRFLFMSFGGDDVSRYHIRGYAVPGEMMRSFGFVTSITDIIEKIEDVNKEIAGLSEKFSAMVTRISDTNMAEIAGEIENFQSAKVRLQARREECEKQNRDCISLFGKMKKQEEILTQRFEEETLKAKSNHDRVRIGDDIQKEIDELFAKKNELIRKTMGVAYKYHKIILMLEEISFDNSIMIDRVKKNFLLLKTISS